MSNVGGRSRIEMRGMSSEEVSRSVTLDII
jgi:hypothetical protein